MIDILLGAILGVGFVGAVYLGLIEGGIKDFLKELRCPRPRPAVPLSHDVLRFQPVEGFTIRAEVLSGHPVCPACLVERNAVVFLTAVYPGKVECQVCKSEFTSPNGKAVAK